MTSYDPAMVDDGASKQLGTIDPWQLCFHPTDGNKFITGTLALQQVSIQKNKLEVVQETPHQKYINCFDYSNSGKLLALGDIDGCVKILKTSDPK